MLMKFVSFLYIPQLYKYRRTYVSCELMMAPLFRRTMRFWALWATLFTL